MFSRSTERRLTSVGIHRFILFHHKKHPKEIAESEIRQFIAHLAVNARISASTQTVALSALLFLHRNVLKKDLPYIANIERAKPSKKLPVVFTRREVEAVLVRLSGNDGGVRMESKFGAMPPARFARRNQIGRGILG
jgi:site-specific recombinase XerD